MSPDPFAKCSFHLCHLTGVLTVKTSADGFTQPAVAGSGLKCFLGQPLSESPASSDEQPKLFEKTQILLSLSLLRNS